MSLRLQRVQELLKREIGEAVRRALPILEVGVISVNDVIVAPDLHNATVYVTVLGDSEQKKRAQVLLRKNRKLIQGMVGKAVVLKYTPQLRFVFDLSIERGNRILEILDDIEKNSPEI